MSYFINELPLISLSTVQWTIENVISLISVFLVGVGGVLALLQWRSASKVKRAEFVNQMIEKLRLDQDMVNAMGMVDYGTIRYDESFHNGTDGKEAQIDKLLSYLSIVCFLRTLHVIQKDEFAFLNIIYTESIPLTPFVGTFGISTISQKSEIYGVLSIF